MSHYVSAREETANPDAFLKALFLSRFEGPSDAMFLSSKRICAIGVCGLPYRAPAIKELRKLPGISKLIGDLKTSGDSLLIRVRADGGLSIFRAAGTSVSECALPADIVTEATAVIRSVSDWAGNLNERGEHVVGIKTPSPGPHFFVNLLLGNRMDFDFPLQTTPKSVVDRLGRGSFRSHAATQVLATRWDLRQEENGFPCNRQFYLVENNAQIFYSGNPEDPSVTGGKCVHAQNRTNISYDTSCGLKVERTIFLPRQEKGLPIAVEVQRIAIKNDTAKPRSLKLVYTGMFGPSKPPALQEDVLYSNIIMEGGMILDDTGTVRAVSPHYFPAQDREDLRFHSMVVRDETGNRFPDSYCLNYNDFVGRGSVEYPDGLCALTNELYRKGPGFFALGAEIEILPGATAIVDNFTGLVSSRANASFGPDSLKTETDNLLRRFAAPESVPAALDAVSAFFDAYASFFSLKTSDADFSAYCSRNLPFQVLYQTFVSRSFDQTQKGYREIGFREIQDLFASMYYFHAQGNGRFVRRLILDWAAQVYEFGFANHNFFWDGKEAGNWSDDALWLHQAVSRYVNLTGDASILDEEVPVAGSGAGTAPVKTRSLYKTLLSAIRYSAEISVGRHGIPLLDRADWNDCLRLDRDYSPGPEKERIYRETGSFKSDGTESVMNGFLAALACGETLELARARNDEATALWLSKTRDGLAKNLKDHAWKNGAYARLLFSKYPGFDYAGADGDGLDTDGSGGTFFLNSFSWSILSGVADDAEIASMLAVVRKKLKTPYGLKLVSLNDLSRVVPGVASAEYFPGDRENGAVFKHASMMAVSAMLDAAKSVKDRSLAAELCAEAWNMIDLVYPARTMTDPFVLAGNPRFCTQYNNSETGENIGPLLSGTATWLILALLKAFGIELTSEGLIIDPILRPDDRETDIALKIGDARISVRYAKPDGFRRRKDGGFKLRLDGKLLEGNAIPLDLLREDHQIVAEFA